METLAQQFTDALRRIEAPQSHLEAAQAAHEEVRELLVGDPTLVAWAISPVLIGSYARRTAIYPGKDVDILLRCEGLDTSAEPGEVFDAVRLALLDGYGERVTVQARSVKVDFDADEISVDAVPAVRADGHWAIPSRNPDLWGTSGRWILTDPLAVSEAISTVNGAATINGRGCCVPLIKLVKQIRQHHLGDARPGGFYFELLTYRAIDAAVRTTSFAEALADTLAYAARHLASADPLLVPGLDAPFDPEPSESDRRAAAVLMADLAARANDALSLDRCGAAVAWREVIGRNDNGQCFPLPSGCDETGRKVPSVRPAIGAGLGEAGGFA